MNTASGTDRSSSGSGPAPHHPAFPTARVGAGQPLRWFAVLVVAFVGLTAIPAHASTTPPKVALVYGDSLVWESRLETAAVIATKSGWSVVSHAVPMTAPCDWLARLSDDLAAYRPATVTLATAGNTGGTACMTAPTGSADFYAQYRSDLNAIFSQVTASGAKMVFVDDPPFLNPDRDAAQVQLIAIATQLAGEYHGVSVVSAGRSKLSKSGKYVAYKPCLTNETAAMGCSGGQIAIRTITGPDTGLHLCPSGLAWPGDCPEYSSGEFRFGKVIGSVAVHPPRPVVA